MTGVRRSTDQLSAPDDEALLARIAAHDSQALNLLYERYARVVYGLAVRMLGTADQAEDVVQETFWRVWRRSTTYELRRGSAAGWICSIAHNLSVDELRRQRVRPNYVYETDTSPVLSELIDTRGDVAGIATENERRLLIVAALEQITSEQRQAIELAYFRGLSQSEIAERLQSPIGTIKTRIRLGLRRLREILLAQNIGVEDVTE
ncbi:MAG: sigma-70 family RNA polymerase sigma factor [Kouleothrix sp.]|jgi:RNA polymerase sigma-70 factor (ECF subfamily)|nr:sigma-70 family RNA polymerase sigma factor [Kouleothrix sp.]